MSTTRPTTARAARDDSDGKKSVFKLIGELPNLITTLIRDEIEQIKREAITRLKTAGIGVGLFVGAAVFAYFALWVLIATAILGIATALPPWLSALIVGVALLLVAVVLGLLGLSRVKRGVPPVPKEAVDSVKDDVKAFKGVGHYDR
ncbi:MAG TPA: phage holin family protein [Amnibacterium sp.]|jgi:fatty acid desaturase|nr:phage holin family protein [Amnibacterium sp.]